MERAIEDACLRQSYRERVIERSDAAPLSQVIARSLDAQTIVITG